MRDFRSTTRLTHALCAVLLAACSGGQSDPTASGPSTAAGSGAGTGAAGSGGLPVAGTTATQPAAGNSSLGGRPGGVAGTSAGRPAGSDSGVAGSSAGTGGAAIDAGPDAAEPPSGDAAAPDAAASDEGDLWIATTGADSSPGTQELPLGSLAAAVERVAPGGTIWVSAGTYPVAKTVPLARNGEETKPLRIFALPGERPIFDFMAQPRGDSAARGIQISGNFWHLRGLDVRNAGDNCIHISGSHNTIEQVNTYGCSDTGIQITANSSDAANPERAAYNTVLSCDSHDNYDAANQGENADGFAAKLYIGPGNVFRDSRAWNNADDGWDLFASDDVVVIEDSWAIANGKIGPAQNNTNGDGNGFKLGGAPRAGDANMGGAVHVVKNSISIENAACGFVLNNNSKTPELSMCGGRGDGKGLLCSLTNRGTLTVQMSASEAINAKRDANGKLPPIQ